MECFVGSQMFVIFKLLRERGVNPASESQFLLLLLVVLSLSLSLSLSLLISVRYIYWRTRRSLTFSNVLISVKVAALSVIRVHVIVCSMNIYLFFYFRMGIKNVCFGYVYGCVVNRLIVLVLFFISGESDMDIMLLTVII